MSRYIPHLAELQPELFCEVSPELAHTRGLEHGGWATIVTARAAKTITKSISKPNSKSGISTKKSITCCGASTSVFSRFNRSKSSCWKS